MFCFFLVFEISQNLWLSVSKSNEHRWMVCSSGSLVQNQVRLTGCSVCLAFKISQNLWLSVSKSAEDE
jgi:hypothetical protein